MNITVTRDVIALLNESGNAWIVGEGKQPHVSDMLTLEAACASVGIERGKTTHQMMCEYLAPHPPADLVAATVPCATCEGDGAAANVDDLDDVDVSSEYAYVAADCGECDGYGKPRIDLMVDCDGDHYQSTDLSDLGDWLCTKNCTPGRQVHAATVTAVGKVMPIVDSEYTSIHDQTSPRMVVGHTSTWIVDGSDISDITRPANAKPGMYALQVEKVPE